MARTVGAFEAKTHFSRLLERVKKGEEITITQRGKPVARLVPSGPTHDVAAAMEAAERLRQLGKELNLGPFDWDEWKQYRDEGRRYL
ncbi:MAG: type II toxin-antitoxin system Phd/YefM family antitoxin [Alphaproteobacteria bacterium]|nr:type II toxin-antitoxin system Phd/YefM family antitoxin [Alphaproteobacteria bacterium]